MLLVRGNFSAEAGKVPSGKPGGVGTHFQWLLLGFEFPGPPESPRRDLLMAKQPHSSRFNPKLDKAG